MKRNKKLLTAISLLLSAGILAACSTTSKATFKEYWFDNADIPQYNKTETLTYDVTFQPNVELTTQHLGIHYRNGTYQTSLTLIKEDDGDIYYRYETSLSIEVQYSFDAEQSEWLQDTIVTTTEFKNNSTFQAIRSHKEIVSHSPTREPFSLASTHQKVAYTVDTTYNDDYSGGESKLVNNVTNKSLEKNFTFESDWTNLDNDQLYLAMRGFNTSQRSADVAAYSPFAATVQTIGIYYDNAVSDLNFTFKNGDKMVNRIIDCYPVEMTLTTSNPGATQTAWVAKKTSDLGNEFRNVILKLETPLPYNYGKLVYTLSSADFI